MTEPGIRSAGPRHSIAEVDSARLQKTTSAHVSRPYDTVNALERRNNYVAFRASCSYKPYIRRTTESADSCGFRQYIPYMRAGFGSFQYRDTGVFLLVAWSNDRTTDNRMWRSCVGFTLSRLRLTPLCRRYGPVGPHALQRPLSS